MASSLLSLAFYLSLFASSASLASGSSRGGAANATTTHFSFDFFAGKRAFASDLALSGSAAVARDGSTISISGTGGRVAYKKPITFLGRSPGFSTYFSFSFFSSRDDGDATLAFFLAPRGGARVVAVGFVAGHVEVEVRVGGEVVIKSGDLRSSDLVLTNGSKMHSWVDYNGTSNALQVRVSKSRSPKPTKPLVSYPIDLSNILWRKPMLVGFSSQIASSRENCSLYYWSFQSNHGAPYLMHSQPLDPSDFLITTNESAPPVRVRRSYPWAMLVALVFAAACGAMVTFLASFVWFAVVARRAVAPIEYPVHPSDVVYEKIVLVSVKDDAAGAKE